MMNSKINPPFWGSFIMVLALTLTFYVASKAELFLEANQIISPGISLGWAIGYFFGVVLVMALVLFIIPLSKLRLILRVLFALMFAWGVFIVIALVLPYTVAYLVAVIASLAWLFWARIWLHNLLLLVTLSSAGSVFGFLSPPLTFMIFMLVVAIYDVLAVRLGFMVWMADRLSESTTLPAFIFPKKIGDWTLSLKNVRVGDLKNMEPEKREYSILGGGDIGFPLMLAASVFFAANLTVAILIGMFSLLGLASVFLIQRFWFKGKPMPALPPIALVSLIGFFIAFRFLN